MFKKYEFTERTLFLAFIDNELKKRVLGQKLRGVYTYVGVFDNCSADEPIVFVFNDTAVIVEYLLRSDITIWLSDRKDFENDQTLNYLYRDIEYQKKLRHYVHYCEDFPFYGRRLADISLDGFSHEFEVYRERYRPDGGDYFSVLGFILENGFNLCVCGALGHLNGWTDTWIDGTDASWYEKK